MKKKLFALIIGLCLYVPLPVLAMTDELKNFIAGHRFISIENNTDQSHATILTDNDDPIYKKLLQKTFCNQSHNATQRIYDLTMIESYWKQKIKEAHHFGMIKGYRQGIRTRDEYIYHLGVERGYVNSDVKEALYEGHRIGYFEGFAQGACIAIACMLVSNYIWKQFHPDAQHVAPF